jgi:hypothetical protein
MRRKKDVRFSPNSDHESRHPQKVMSGLPPKADARAHKQKPQPFGLGLRVRLRCKGANQNSAPGTAIL